MFECPLCHNEAVFIRLTSPDGRSFQACEHCRLVFVEKRFLPEREEELARYRSHNNGREHHGYVSFLNQAIDPVLPFLKPGMRGLDYGCGPVPTLSVLLAEKGLCCRDYDPLFFPEKPEGPFDFIFSTECFEHFFSPDKELRLIKSLLAPHGLLAIMTSCWSTPAAFATWSYARDRTHVVFYHPSTFDFICDRYGFSRMKSSNASVILLQNSPE